MGEFTNLGLNGRLYREWANRFWAGARRSELNRLIAHYVRVYNNYARRKRWSTTTAREVYRDWSNWAYNNY